METDIKRIMEILRGAQPMGPATQLNVDYSKWMTVPHASDLPISKN